MYGHQVIEDLSVLMNKDRKNSTLYHELIKNISKSTHFYIGEASSMSSILGNKMSGKEIFKDELSELIRLPYKYCWFDYDLPPNEDKETESTKRGILTSELLPNVIACNIFMFTNYYKHWIDPFGYFVIIIGDTADNIRKKYKILDEMFSKAKDKSTINGKSNIFFNLYNEYS